MGEFTEGFDRNREYNRTILEASRLRAGRAGTPRDLVQLLRVSEPELISRRQRMRYLRAYSAHMFSNMAEGMQSCLNAYMLLDSDGCVVQLRASGEFRELLRKKGIVLGTVWRTDVTGADAVSVGNIERCALQSAGEDNYLQVLQDLALYYAPLHVLDNGMLQIMGGVAYVCPLEEKSEAFMLGILSIASSLNIRVSTAWNTCDSYEGDSRGVVQLDINMKNGKISMTNHNRKFFSMLEIPEMSRRDFYFRPADEVIDPLPANARLWEIIDRHKEVKDRELTIQVQGKRLSRVISTISTSHPELKSKGLLLYITTRKDISQQVADKTGNNAVISFADVVGDSTVMKSRIKRAKLLASTESNIMLLGESGVGKDVFAQAIHNHSNRRNGPFVSVNCGALPRDLIASELFGYDAGAFTGAKKQGNIGKFELAEGGTLFLDEIGEMPLDLQATLLRAVEQKQFMRLGSTRTVKADVRIISATNVDMGRMIREKRFRADLYYRLSTMSMELPPLRARGEDVILLAESFIRRISQKIGRQDIMEISHEAKAFLRSCPWQGNVRELQNLIDCLVQLYPDHVITMGLIRENINPIYLTQENQQMYTETETGQNAHGRVPGGSFGHPESAFGHPESSGVHRYDRRAENAREEWQSAPGGRPGEEGRYAVEVPPAVEKSAETAGVPEEEESRDRRDLPLLTREEILEALEVCEGNRSKAAKYLSVGRRTLYRYIDRLGIGEKQYKK